MNNSNSLRQALMLALLSLSTLAASAPWTYRGTLNDGGQPAQGKYDVRLTLLDAGDNPVRAAITLYGIDVNKGSFETKLDFDIDPNTIPGAKLRTEVAQGNSGFFEIGKPKAINGGVAECWDVDGNTAVASSQLGVTDASAPLLSLRNNNSILFLRGNGGVEQNSSFAPGVSSAAWGLSTARGVTSFAVGRAIIGVNGTNSFAYSDVVPAQVGGTPGFSDAPGEFLVRSGGGIGFNTVPSDSDFAIGPRPGLDANTLLHFDANGRTAKMGLLANGQTGINAPATLFLQSVDAVGINALTGDLTSFIDLAIRPKASGADGDVDINLVSRDGLKTVGLVNDQDTGTFFINVSPNAGAARLNINGATLSNGGAWTNQSSRSLKHGFASVDPLAVLAKVTSLPITTWSYKNSEEGRHMGPVAEDFKAAFDLAGDGKSIGTVDADGVALAAIQGLNQKLEIENSELRARLTAIEAKLGK
jgi:hypothetical protein